MSPRAKILKLCCFALMSFLLKRRACHALDALYPGQSLSGNQTLLSQNKTFELGFFSPGQSGAHYVGMWYTILLPWKRTVVWVANRENPISDPSSCELKLLKNGDLMLLDRSKEAPIWSTKSSSSKVNSTTVRLLDNGNLIVRDSSSNLILWQSFDYPTDHWLPGGKIGYNKLQNTKQSLTAWKSFDNPSPSLFSLEDNGTSHLLLWNQSELYWSSGEWNGKLYSSVPEIKLNSYVKNMTHVSNENESYSTYVLGEPGALTRFVVDTTGQYKQFVWRPNFTDWSLYWTSPPHQCQVYAFCGAFSICSNVEVPLCRCFPGFEPVVLDEWDLGDHSSGCGRNRDILCDESDEFIAMKQMQFSVDDGDDGVVTASEVSNGNDCRLSCVKNCNCSAYAFGDDGRCLQWIGKLYNFLQLLSDDSSGKEIHIRVSSSDAKAHTNRRDQSKKSTLWIVLGTVLGSLALLFVVIIVVLARKRLGKVTSVAMEGSLTVFQLRDLRIATKNFSDKLGEGGFGSVFKGTLSNSKVVGVKRLKNVNVQEKNQEKQFRAEVSTIGTIQHINLVRLLGFCIQDSERFLVYDYMTNGSLESKLFPSKEDPNANQLDWKTRHKIAMGTARGLAYLHEKCRDCIIHCDVKPENVLLDEEFNPKVADFGLAKLVGRDFTRVLTTVRGTLGYLAPEWLSGEPITAKADVFSYGMLLFEMVSGRRNRDHFSVDDGRYFPAAVAMRVRSGEGVMGLLDPRLGGDADEEEVYTVCKVACWCIQDDERDRPSMGQVVQILEGVLEVDVCRNIPRLLLGFVDGDGGADSESVVFFDDAPPSFTR